jgi:aminoglycoside/choline kinase family phosphotransferase
MLKGDASNRRFWRFELNPADQKSPNLPLFTAPRSAIAVDLGPDDLPLYARALGLLPTPPAEPPWITLHRFLSAIGVAVPALYVADSEMRMLMVEDVGETPLFEAAAYGNPGDLYRLAADELLLIHLEGTRRLDDDCIAARIAYDARLFRWELEQFAQYGASQFAPGVERRAVAPELDALAIALDRLPRVLSHRDFHGHNLLVQTVGGDKVRVRVIDFQDALRSPAAQDLAVLLTTRDAARIITPAVEQRVLGYYYSALIRRGAATIPFNEFMASYRLCVLQHALKVIGRFIVLEREGKRGYAPYIPYALEQARRMLAEGSDFPVLRAALAA